MRILFILINLIFFNCTSQNYFSIDYNVGLNATVVKSQNYKVDGVMYPIYPNTWNNKLNLVYHNNQYSFGFSAEQGSLGIIYSFKNVYPQKFPSDIDKRIDFTRKLNNYKYQFNLNFNYEFCQHFKFRHYVSSGLGLLLTTYNDNTSGFGSAIELDTLNGGILSYHLMGTYGYSNQKYSNFMLNFGYKISYMFLNNFSLNMELMYNQGVRKMLNIPFFREFDENQINYHEKEEFNAYTKLSHFTIAIGVGYNFKQLNNAHNSRHGTSL